MPFTLRKLFRASDARPWARGTTTGVTRAAAACDGGKRSIDASRIVICFAGEESWHREVVDGQVPGSLEDGSDRRRWTRSGYSARHPRPAVRLDIDFLWSNGIELLAANDSRWSSPGGTCESRQQDDHPTHTRYCVPRDI